MKTGDAATIAAPHAENASLITMGFASKAITMDGACIQGRTEIEKDVPRSICTIRSATLDEN